jgi:Fic family protein
MKRFDYSFLERSALPAGLFNVTNAISELKGMEARRRGANAAIFTALERVARVQSVGSSNALEGVVTSEQRLHAIVNQSSAPLNHNEQEIAGYRDALGAIHEGFARLDARESDVLRLHGLLLAYTPQGGGQYKQSENAIIEVDAQGRRKLRFAPVSAAETPAAMEQLTLAYLDAKSNANISDLLLIPCLVLDFLCIHPFADGNGRLSRLLSLLLLYKTGFDAGKYISFEAQINTGKVLYYEALRQSSEGWHDNANSYIPFIENFLQTLLLCYKALDQRFALVQAGRVNKKSRIEATVLNNLLPISKQEIAAVLPDVSPTTIEAVLGAMVKAGQVEKIGAARNTKYMRKG